MKPRKNSNYMHTILRFVQSRLLIPLVASSVITTASAQEVLIPDPGLNAAVRETLGKPNGPLTEQDMLGLTVLNAHDRNIGNLAGLEAARNLNTLLLFSNHLTNFSLPTLTNLVVLDLSANSLTNVFLPAGMSNLFSLLLGDNLFTQITLPSDLTQLVELDLQPPCCKACSTRLINSFCSSAVRLSILDKSWWSSVPLSSCELPCPCP